MSLFLKRAIYLVGAVLVSVAITTSPTMAQKPSKVQVDRVELRGDDQRGGDKDKDKDKDKNKHKDKKPKKKCPTPPCPHGHGEDDDD